MSYPPQHHMMNVVAVVTSMQGEDYDTAARLIDSLDAEETSCLIAGLVGAVQATNRALANELHYDPDELLADVLQGSGIYAAQRQNGETP